MLRNISLKQCTAQATESSSMCAKKYDDQHKVVKNGKQERAKHVNAIPYKREKYKYDGDSKNF